METAFPSPSGKYVFHILVWEARMSLWGESPRLVEARRGSVLFDLTGTRWSLDRAQWEGEEEVQLWLRRYPDDHQPSSFEVLVECDAKVARLEGQGIVALQELEKALEALYARGQVSF